MKLHQLVMAALAVSSTAALAAGNTAEKSAGASPELSASSQSQVASSNGSTNASVSLNESTAAPSPMADSAAVSQLQQALNDKGFSVGPVDGIAGPRTKSAIKKFQKAQGLNASGQLDQPLLLALGIAQNGSTASQNGASETPQDGNTSAPASSGQSTGSGYSTK